jgi:hypothetical protein
MPARDEELLAAAQLSTPAGPAPPAAEPARCGRRRGGGWRPLCGRRAFVYEYIAVAVSYVGKRDPVSSLKGQMTQKCMMRRDDAQMPLN